MLNNSRFLLRAIAMVVLLIGFLLGSCTSLNVSKEAKNKGFVQMFNGKNLDGWEGDPAYWTCLPIGK